MMFLFSFIITCLIGLSACYFVLQKANIKSTSILFGAGIPLGIGISSANFIILNLLGFSALLIVFIELALVLAIIYKYLRFEIKNIQQYFTLPDFFKAPFKDPILLALNILYFYAIILAIGSFYYETLIAPHGKWDAWADWNLGARMIARDPNGWASSFNEMMSEDFHTDYPLLQKGTIAKWWILLGSESTWIPAFFSFIITFSAVFLATGVVNHLCGKKEALVAGLILLCTPFYLYLGSSQYADNTVGYFFLLSLVMLILARNSESKGKRELYILAGVAGSLAAWSKNEGLLFMVSLMAAQIPLLYFKNKKERYPHIKYMIYGMLPIFLLIIFQKAAISPPNQIILGQGEQTIDKLQDLSRYEAVWDYYKYALSRPGNWAFNAWWLFLLGLIVKGGINITNHNYAPVASIIWLLLMLAGYFFIEIITPLDLSEYLEQSVFRLFGQLYPSFLIIYFISLPKQSNWLKFIQ